jgi:hypothetical protein
MRAAATVTVAVLTACFAPSASLAAWPPGGLKLERPAPSGSSGLLDIGPDAAGGTYVAWPEMDSTGATAYRVHRLTSSGDPPAGWTATGVRACSPAGFFVAPALVPDGGGGTYLIWTDFTPSTFVGHIGPTGALAPGWPPQGVPVSTTSGQQDVVAAADGAGGVLLAWERTTSGTTKEILLQHFLPDGTRATGFPAAGRPVTSAFTGQVGKFKPRLVRDGTRGFWLSFATIGLDSVFAPSAYAVMQLGPGGLPIGGQPVNGLALSLPAAEIGTLQPYVPVALGLDGSGGVFAFTVGGNGNVRAFHVLATVEEDPGWPAGGVVIAGGAGWPSVHFPTEENWPVAAGDLAGAAYVGWRDQSDFLLHGSRVSPDGVTTGWAGNPVIAGEMEATLVAEPAGVYACALVPVGCAHFDCVGPFVIARFDAAGTIPEGWPGPHPPPTSVPGIVLGDGGPQDGPRLAADGAGGVVAAWIQYPDYYALRLTVAGQLAGVPPARAGDVALGRARFDPATGVRVTCSIGDVPAARLELFDVAGRRIASASVARPAGDVVLPGTRGLAPGLYVIRLSAGSRTALAKLAITR